MREAVEGESVSSGKREKKVVALGNFDGVHLGHREVIESAISEGKRRGVGVLAATFDPHPRAVLRPDSSEPTKLLTSIAARRELLLEAGVDEVAVIHFDEALSRKTPEEFVEEALVGDLAAVCVVVGRNFRFGHRAAGHFEDLNRILRSFGGEAVGIDVRASDSGAGVISSTRIRTLLDEGKVGEAATLLGRTYSLPGEVVGGDGRGRTIGFPTANLRLEPDLLVPARGVYACRVGIDGETFGACVNIGVAPTFGERERRVEAHLLDLDRDLYGERLEVEFVARIRGEKRFDGVEELVGQIRRDVEEAREILGSIV